jgi:hypothetical protein
MPPTSNMAAMFMVIIILGAPPFLIHQRRESRYDQQEREDPCDEVDLRNGQVPLPELILTRNGYTSACGGSVSARRARVGAGA